MRIRRFIAVAGFALAVTTPAIPAADAASPGGSARGEAPGQRKAPGESARAEAPGRKAKTWPCPGGKGASCYAPGRNKFSAN